MSNGKEYTDKPRKPRNIEEIGKKVINTLIGGIGVATGFAANELRKLKKFEDKVKKAQQKAHMKRFEEKRKARLKKQTPFGKGGGGVGGFGKFSTINRAIRSGSKLKLPPKDFL